MYVVIYICIYIHTKWKEEDPPFIYIHKMDPPSILCVYIYLQDGRTEIANRDDGKD